MDLVQNTVSGLHMVKVVKIGYVGMVKVVKIANFIISPSTNYIISHLYTCCHIPPYSLNVAGLPASASGMEQIFLLARECSLDLATVA